MIDTHKELNMTRVFNAPREKVYKAWTDPKLLTQWWGPSGVFTPVCELDLKPGGRIYIVMEAGAEMGDFKGTQWPMEGEFVELDEPSKIVFKATAINNGQPTLEHLTTVTFAEADEKTTMKVEVVVTKVQPGPASEYAIGGMEMGWNSQFDKLVEFVKNGLV